MVDDKEMSVEELLQTPLENESTQIIPKKKQSPSELRNEMLSSIAAVRRLEEEYRQKLAAVDEDTLKTAENIRRENEPKIDPPYADPYPNWNSSNPNPNHRYTGALYRLALKQQVFQGDLDEEDFSEIAMRYGIGEYIVRLWDNSGPSFRFRIDARFRANAIAKNPETYMEIMQQQIEAKKMMALDQELMKPITFEAKPEKSEESLIISMMRDQQKSQADIVNTLLGKKPDGASGKELADNWDKAFKAGMDSLAGTIELYKSQINDLSNQRDDAIEKIDELQRELGQLPDNTEPEEPEIEPRDQGNPLIGQILQGIEGVNTLLDKVNQNKQNQTPPRQIITHQPPVKQQQIAIMKETKTEDIKKALIRAYEMKAGYDQTSAAIKMIIDKLSAIDKAPISIGIQSMDPDSVTSLLIAQYMPSADAPMKEFVKGVVIALKKLMA